METFDFDEWWTTVEIEDASAKTLLEDWFRDSKCTSRDALMGLLFQSLPEDLILGWKFALMTAVKKLAPVALVQAPVVAGGPVGFGEDAFVGLLRQQFPHMEINNSTLRTMHNNFPQRVINAITFGSPSIASDVYYAAARLPSYATAEDFAPTGYQMNGPLYEGSELTTCFKDDKMYVVKGLMPEELSRAQQFIRAFGESYPPYIITFELITSSRGNTYMIMPAMRYSLERRRFKPYLTSDEVNLLWRNLSTALIHLHKGGFSFMDIKPANICYDDGPLITGYFLIDLGSIVPFGRCSSSTEAYVPIDQEMYPASAEIDWWMFGATLAEFGCGVNGLSIGFGKRFSKQEIISQLRDHLPDPVRAEFLSIVENL